MNVPERVLVVDDDHEIVMFVSEYLKSRSYEIRGTTDPCTAPALFESFSPDVCVIDFRMPNVTGGELLNQFKRIDSEVEVLFLTGEKETGLAIDLMKSGAIDYLMKPVNLRQLDASLSRAIEHRRLVQEVAAYKLHLETLVTQKTAALNDTLRNLASLHSSTLDALGMAMDFRDQSTGGHCRRVANLTTGIAREIGIAGSDLTQIEQGAFLHDLGKLKIPDGILLKPARLTEDEWAVMRNHPRFGKEFLSNIDFLRPAAEIVYTHHEKFDGSGYPRGLRGEAIPVGARIFAIVDAVDAMIYERPYHHPIPFSEAVAEIHRCSGTHFDPDLVEPALGYLALHLPNEKGTTRS